MPSIVIAEKPSQARDYEGAIGSRYGKILAARGHLFKLADPEDENPEWKQWSIGVMRPESGFYRTVLQKDADVRRRYNAIKDAAKGADRIYVATDPDREGEGIGGNIVNQLRRDIGWNGVVMRVLPLGTDKKSLQEAFENARPGDEFRNLFQSYMARSQSDQIFNLSLTRSASKAFLPEGVRASLSIGRVLTPTFGMVCRRHLEIERFKPQKYYVPWVDVKGVAGAARLSLSAKEDGRIFDGDEARRIAGAAEGYEGPISVKTDRKRQAPPPLFSLSKLQVEASRRLKWGVQKTLDVLQSLYQDHKVATYPRSSEVSLPEAEIANVPAMVAGAFALPFVGEVSWKGAEPTIRVKKGAFSDKDLKGAAHYAIVPNVNTASSWAEIYQRMNRDEQRLFEIIVQRYLAAIAPDRIYDSTKLSVSVSGREFSATGIVEIEAGWKEIAASGSTRDQDDNGDDDEDGASEALPAFSDQDRVSAVRTGADEKLTTPPPAFSEATLATAMIEAWKLVDDPATKAKMKETDGIGTEATRAGVIENLVKRGFVKSDKGKLAPTPEGLQFFERLNTYAPKLFDVGLTGEMEIALESVKSGEVGARSAVEAVVGLAQSVVDSFLKGKSEGATVAPPPAKGGKPSRRKRAGKPTEPMKKAAIAKAEREGKAAPPDGVLEDFDKCRAYLGPLPNKTDKATRGGASSRKPSDKQVALVKKLSKQSGVSIPDGVLQDSKKASDWISLQLK